MLKETYKAWQSQIPYMKSCLGKVPFKDELEARAQATHASLRFGHAMSAYRCWHCHQWHVGTRKEN